MRKWKKVEISILRADTVKICCVKEAVNIKKCSFCGNDIDLAGKLVQSRVRKEVFICEKCSEIVLQLYRKDEGCQKREGEEKREDFMELEETGIEIPSLTPREIHRELNRFIVGQERAKRILSVAVCNHIKRLNDKTGLIKKSNILLAGSSGTGKTLFASTLAKLMKVPFAILDATTMTAAGYIGNDVDVCLQTLLDKADGDVDLAQKGIVFIDEIDKLARSGQTTAVSGGCSGLNVQAALLKMIEGCEMKIPPCGKTRQSMESTVKIDTKHILFICGGAFSGLVGKAAKPRPIGIRIPENTDSRTEKNDIIPEDLVKYGLMQELVGRLPVIITLDDLTVDDLVQILTKPEDSIIKEYEALFKQDGVSLSFEESALRQIAETALENKTGARGLRSILENTLADIMYELPNRQNVSGCSITRETLKIKIPVLTEPATASKSCARGA